MQDSQIYSQKKSEIQNRLRQFENLPRNLRIKEFIFCLLTPQSQAKKCWQAVEEIFSEQNKLTEEKLAKILSTKTRFHNTKAKRVLEGFENWRKIENKLENSDAFELRNWLAENVNGYGLKESGHFLRNIGKSKNKIAILDRHILRNLKSVGVIEEEKIKNQKHYLEIENAFIKYSGKVKIPIDELDLLWWSKENGEIFK